MVLWQMIEIFLAPPPARVSPALVGTWVALIIAALGLYYNGLRNRRETIKAMDTRTVEVVHRVLADPELKRSFDERTKWIIGHEFSERAVSFVSRERYEERNEAISERFAGLEKQLSEINTKIDAVPEKVRKEVVFILDNRGVFKREDR